MKRKWFTVLAIISVVLVTVFIFRGIIISNIAGAVVLKAGKLMKFGDYTVFIEKIEGNKLTGIKISGDNRKLEAKSGDYQYIFNENLLKFNLMDGIAEDVDPENTKAFRRLTFKQVSMKIRLKQPGSKQEGILKNLSF